MRLGSWVFWAAKPLDYYCTVVGCRYPIRICPNIVSGPLLYPSTRFGVSPIGDERVREGKIGLSCNGVVEVTSPKGTKKCLYEGFIRSWEKCT